MILYALLSFLLIAPLAQAAVTVTESDTITCMAPDASTPVVTYQGDQVYLLVDGGAGETDTFQKSDFDLVLNVSDTDPGVHTKSFHVSTLPEGPQVKIPDGRHPANLISLHFAQDGASVSLEIPTASLITETYTAPMAAPLDLKARTYATAKVRTADGSGTHSYQGPVECHLHKNSLSVLGGLTLYPNHP